MSLYAALGAQVGASHEELRKLYLESARELHPDKHKRDLPLEQQRQQEQAFLALQEAWNVLGDAHLRKRYDAELVTQDLHLHGAVQVDLDDLPFDEATETFTYVCRCGDKLLVTEDDLASGCDVFECSSCSLRMQILYEEN